MRRSLFFPLPLWERVAARQRGRVRGGHKLRASRYPSSVADFVRATFSHKGRRKEESFAPARSRVALCGQLRGLVLRGQRIDQLAQRFA